MQATVETVIKVSGNRKQDPEPEPMPEETPVPAVEHTAEPEHPGSLNSIIHHSWGHPLDRKAVPEVHPHMQSLLVPYSKKCSLKCRIGSKCEIYAVE